jgi:hypothetical protein
VTRRAQVCLLAAVAGLCWLPYAGRRLSPDEGGLLLLASQWSPGSSLYGDYFVDRPPGLIALAAVADAAGGGWAFRALGILAVVSTVLLSGVLGRIAAPDRPSAPVLTAATATLLTATPLFGGTVVNGEVLGLPFLVGGCAAVIAASRAERWLPWAVLGGVLGAAGVLVKQSLLDVFVLAVVLLVARRRLGALGAVVIAALATVAVAVGAAGLLGTAPGELWDAVVVFRREAAAVIAASATGSTTARLGGMLLALLATGAPLLAFALARRARGSWLWWPALAVLAWELFVVLGGGSYWLHYLMGLVPGLVLITAAAAQQAARPGRLLAASYAVVAVSTIIALVVVAVRPIARPEQPAIAWLDDHARPGETAVVAFGAPNILQATGLRSPYPDLWSLPVRVHDPELHDLSALLEDQDRPRWVVVAGKSLGSWGIDGSAANRVLAEHYVLATTAGDWTIYEETDR